MNYLKEILAFYDTASVKPMSTGQIALWHTLMYINNKNGWTEWFSVPNMTLEILTGLSRSGILKCRNALKQSGFIDFRPCGTKATSYKIIPAIDTMSNSTQVSTQVSTQASTQVSTQVGTQVSTQVGAQIGAPLDKPKLKLKLNKENAKKKVAAFTTDPALRDALLHFCDIRMGMRTPFTEYAFDLLLGKLGKLAADSTEQTEIVQQSIERGWNGFFPKKDKDKKWNYNRPEDDLPY